MIESRCLDAWSNKLSQSSRRSDSGDVLPINKRTWRSITATGILVPFVKRFIVLWANACLLGFHKPSACSLVFKNQWIIWIPFVLLIFNVFGISTFFSWQRSNEWWTGKLHQSLDHLEHQSFSYPSHWSQCQPQPHGVPAPVESPVECHRVSCHCLASCEWHGNTSSVRSHPGTVLRYDESLHASGCSWWVTLSLHCCGNEMQRGCHMCQHAFCSAEFQSQHIFSRHCDQVVRLGHTNLWCICKFEWQFFMSSRTSSWVCLFLLLALWC